MPVEIARRLFDVDEYQRMAEVGILSEHDRVELIDGEIVAMTPIGPRHNAVTDRLARALMRAVGEDAIVRNQGSIQLDRFRQPQPDFSLLRPRADFYATALPGPGDILLVVEVAESSLEYDRGVKARIYAQAGLPEYWLVDLRGGVVTRFTDPHGGTYRKERECRAGESIAPEMLPQSSIPAEALLAD